MKTYTVNEVFYSLQGEGMRAGTANVFVRFSGCNLTCKRDNEAGFDCDTEFTSGRSRSLSDLLLDMNNARGPGAGPKACVLTGGEPLLQVDTELLDALHANGWFVAIETNGTQEVPSEGVIDWLTVSPKSAEHTLRVKECSELKYVRFFGQGCPRSTVKATHYLLSPAFDPDLNPSNGALAWCIELVKQNSVWRLSVQQHKSWRVR